MIRVAVASGNALKKQAVEEAFARCGYGLVVTSGHAVESGVAAQPFRFAEIHTGAANRLQATLARIASAPVDFVVSMENGVVDLTPDVTIDLAIVLLYDTATKQTYISTSAGVPFPAHAIRKARRAGFKTTTVGSILAADDGDAADPHATLCFGATNRQRLLTEAVTICLGQQRRASA